MYGSSAEYIRIHLKEHDRPTLIAVDSLLLPRWCLHRDGTRSSVIVQTAHGYRQGFASENDFTCSPKFIQSYTLSSRKYLRLKSLCGMIEKRDSLAMQGFRKNTFKYRLNKNFMDQRKVLDAIKLPVSGKAGRTG
jgi:hypothetical protein